jgi:hypothetical protein
VIRCQLENNTWTEDDFRQAATVASQDGPTVAAIGAAAQNIYATASAVLAGSGSRFPSNTREKDEVLASMKIITANSSFARAGATAPGSTIEVFLVTSPHPATVRWEEGTGRTYPTTGFMRRGLSAGG